MSKKSVVSEAQEIQLAIELIQLGARLQLLESEVSLSRERLIKLYKELKGVSPPKGMLPFSTDWFMTWQPNIHASLFYNIHTYLMKSAPIDDSDAIVKAYELYTAEVKSYGVEPMLSLTRACPFASWKASFGPSADIPSTARTSPSASRTMNARASMVSGTGAAWPMSRAAETKTSAAAPAYLSLRFCLSSFSSRPPTAERVSVPCVMAPSYGSFASKV